MYQTMVGITGTFFLFSAHEYTRFRLQDHNYMCNDFEEKYCHREKLLEHIEYLEVRMSDC